MTTAEQVLAALALYDLKREGKEYRSNSPLRRGSNSHAFCMTFDADGEHGAYHDHVSGDSGTLYDLAKAMGIALPERESEIRKGYASLEEYALAHGVEPEVFTEAGWIETEHQGRPCLKFPTANGAKVRFLDGEKPKFKPVETGYHLCWYGLKFGIPMAYTKGVLVITNGEPSVIAAQAAGIPAICHTGGETAGIPDTLIDDLTPRYQGEIIVALDCDEAGHKGAAKWRAALERGGYKPRVVDMRLSDKGDLADFCMLYDQESLAALQKCEPLSIPGDMPAAQPEKLLVTRSTILQDFIRQLSPDFAPIHPPLINPLNVLHKFGGEAHILEPGQMVGIVGVSGTGKTSMLETIIDSLLRYKKNVLVWSPEWKPEQFAQRAVQRYGGATMEAMRLHKLWQYEKSQGIEHGDGVPLSAAVVSTAFDKAEMIGGFPGDTAYPIKSKMTIDEFLDRFPAMLSEFEKPFHALIIDYAQLLHALDRTKNISMYDVLMRVKDLCLEHHLVGFVASQTTKADARNQQDSTLLDSSSARFVNEDAFNLFVTLNPERLADGTWANSGVLNVVKNSTGRRGKVRVYMNLSMLSWIDKEHSNQDFSQYDKGH